jgi:RNA polymerase sigma factor (sigma-70 family)
METTFERFSWRARRALVMAQEEARLLKHSAIAPEHLLLGLARSDTGSAAGRLRDEGFDLDEIRSEIQHKIADYSDAGSDALGLTPRTKRVITLAIAAADRMQSRAIGTQHLLLGLLAEGEGVAFELLSRWGVTPASVRAETSPLQADGSPLRETVLPTQSFTASDQLLKEQVQSILGSLSKRERGVLEMRFGLKDGQGHTLEEVAKEFGVRPEQVRQIEAKALELLTHSLQS